MLHIFTKQFKLLSSSKANVDNWSFKVKRVERVYVFSQAMFQN